MAKYDCSPCGDLELGAEHTLYLGLSVINADVSLGWNTDPTALTVVLVEDTCTGNKVFWDECMQKSNYTGADFGFFGENRYQRTDGTLYSAQTKEDPSDTKIRDSVDLIGRPSYFRVGNFEYSGIIIDWTKTKNATRTTYQIKLSDTKTILEGVYLIVGQYSGCVNQTISVGAGGTGCPEVNLFNVYGYMEQFGNYCPPYGYCGEDQYSLIGNCVSGLPIDGTIFGSPIFGFGGSYWNEEGMPLSKVIQAFNLLVNSTTANTNCFSPYGRICYYGTEIPAGLSSQACGLMSPDSSAGGCFDDKDFYFLDLSELTNYVSPYYRIPGPVVSVAELLNQLSQDFLFDYYVELVPFASGSGTGCVTKLIKVRTVSRNVQPNLTAISDFIENNECFTEKTLGQELRHDGSSKFIIGGLKQFVYEIGDYTDPEGDGTNNLTSINAETGLVETKTYTPRESASLEVIDPCSLSGVEPNASGFGTLYYSTTNIGTYPYISGTQECSEFDDVIVPFFGLDYNKDIIPACKDEEGFWFFDAPGWEIQSQLTKLNFNGLEYIRIGEIELLAALEGFDHWMSYVMSAKTETSSAFPLDKFPLKDFYGAFLAIANGEELQPKDISNPSSFKFIENTNTDAQRVAEDMQSIFNWVENYATEYYGKKFAIRMPFTCCWWDPETQRTRISELPTNDGGWTEKTNVLDLPNNDPNTIGQFDDLSFFRDDLGKVTSFVKYSPAILKTISALGKDDFLLHYKVDSGDLGSIQTDDGPPSSGITSPAVYMDQLTGVVYQYNVQDSQWQNVLNSCIYIDSGHPSGQNIPIECFGVYVNEDNDKGYLNLDDSPSSVLIDGENYYSSSSWLEVDFFLYVRAIVEEEYSFQDRSTCFGPRAIVSVPQSVNQKTVSVRYANGLWNSLDKIARYATCSTSGITGNEQAKTKITRGVGSDDAWLRLAERACLPDAVAISVQSKNITYGPWYNPSSIPGATEVVNDNSLVPWNYGSYSNLNTAGQFLANTARSDMRSGEMGRLCVPGYPTLPLGAELGAVANGFYPGGSYLVENRSLNSDNFNETNASGLNVNLDYYYWNLPSGWSGIYGPNITNINITPTCPPTTCYNMRTFSPPRRGGIAKWTLEQFQKYKNAINYQTKTIKSQIDTEKKLKFSRSFSSVQQDKRTSPKGRIKEKSNSVTVFAGQAKNWKNGKYKRAGVAALQTEHMSEDIQHDYNEKAYMGLEGLLRPVSMDGDGSLPQYVGYSSVETDAILQDDLNPLTNPQNFSRNKVSTERSDTPNVGHDYEILGRKDTIGQGVMPIDGYGRANESDYANDYRFMALKGPLVMQSSWGYDLDNVPVPNKNDVEADTRVGTFKSTGLDSDKFLDNHLRKSDTWPVAPIDLRLDRDRGVWVAPKQEEQNIQYIKVTGPSNACCVHPGAYRKNLQVENSGSDCGCGSNTVAVLEKVWLEGWCGQSLNTDSCYYAHKVIDNFTCGGETKPLYKELGCDKCCPTDYGARLYITSDNLCFENIIADVCFTDCAITYSVPTGLGPAVQYSGGLWVGSFECEYEQPIFMHKLEIDNPDPEIIWVELTSCYGSVSVASPTRYWYNNNGDVAEYTGPVTVTDVLDGCYVLTDDIGNIQTETCKTNYTFLFWCDSDNQQAQLQLYHVPGGTNPWSNHTVPSGWYPDLSGCEPVQIPYYDTPTSVHSGEICLNVAFGTAPDQFLEEFGQGYTANYDLGYPGGNGLSLDPYKFHNFCGCCELRRTPGESVEIFPRCDTIPELEVFCPSGNGVSWNVSW